MWWSILRQSAANLASFCTNQENYTWENDLFLKGCGINDLVILLHMIYWWLEILNIYTILFSPTFGFLSQCIITTIMNRPECTGVPPAIARVHWKTNFVTIATHQQNGYGMLASNYIRDPLTNVSGRQVDQHNIHSEVSENVKTRLRN